MDRCLQNIGAPCTSNEPLKLWANDVKTRDPFNIFAKLLFHGKHHLNTNILPRFHWVLIHSFRVMAWNVIRNLIFTKSRPLEHIGVFPPCIEHSMNDITLMTWSIVCSKSYELVIDIFYKLLLFTSIMLLLSQI